MAGKIYAYRKKKVWRHKGAKQGIAKARKSRWKVPDKGKRGRTPISKQWFKTRGDIKLGHGYTKLPAKYRHKKLRSLDKKKTITSRSLWNELHGSANVNTNKSAKKVFRTDAKWVMRNLMSRQEKKRMTTKARMAR